MVPIIVGIIVRWGAGPVPARGALLFPLPISVPVAITVAVAFSFSVFAVVVAVALLLALAVLVTLSAATGFATGIRTIRNADRIIAVIRRRSPGSVSVTTVFTTTVTVRARRPVPVLITVPSAAVSR